VRELLSQIGQITILRSTTSQRRFGLAQHAGFETTKWAVVLGKTWCVSYVYDAIRSRSLSAGAFVRSERSLRAHSEAQYANNTTRSAELPALFSGSRSLGGIRERPFKVRTIEGADVSAWRWHRGTRRGRHGMGERVDGCLGMFALLADPLYATKSIVCR